MSEPSYPLHLQRLVEEYLEGLDFGADRRAARLVEAMRYSLLAGGKRIRPVLTLAVVESRGAEPAAALPTAAALELIHTYSLIHDDLPSIDDDDLRRGRPTCHVVYGEDVAILAGDGLFSEAFRLVLDRQKADSGTLLAVVAEIARATGVGGMVGGQFMDVAGLAADHDDLRAMHALKTGRLIEAAIVAGALLSGAGGDLVAEVRAGAAAGGAPAAKNDRGEEVSGEIASGVSGEIAAYRAFATELGVLFQIVDDILDETGDAAVLGKTAGKDRRQEKATYVALFGLEEARRLAEETHGRALDALRALPGDTAVLTQIAGYILHRKS
jgi:geranylgeranyl diphosphate synthase type II